MKKILLIKMTSMGDLMHALPALTDAANVFPDIQFDWVVDEAFSDIPLWHPSVNRVIKSAHRRWKKQVSQSFSSGELGNFYRQLNMDNYDYVIDSQSNLKSATVALLRRIGKTSGNIHGLDRNGVREKPAHWVYQHQYTARRNEHSILQQRRLMANVLGYPVPDSNPNFGIDRIQFQLPAIDLPENFVFFVHNASWKTKLWPEQHWRELIDLATESGISVLLPSGNEEEQKRAERLSMQHQHVIALPRLSLSEIAAIMDKAMGAVCCDTGLGHLAGVLDLPSVSFYGPTDAMLIGATGLHQEHLIASTTDFLCSPCYKKNCHYENTETSAIN
jgi:heptosyltransferase-1